MGFKNTEEIKKFSFKLLCVLCPSILLLLLWPPVKEFPPLLITENLNAFQIYIGASYWVGVFSGPGYIYFLFRRDISPLEGFSKVWVRISLYTAFFASFGGLIFCVFIIPAPFVLGTIVCTFLVIKKFSTHKKGIIN